MKYSRPGFSTVVSSDNRPAKPARLNMDMQPAIAKRTSASQGPVSSPLKQMPQGDIPAVSAERMQAQAEAAWKAMQQKQILVNPAPSATPILTTPHKATDDF